MKIFIFGSTGMVGGYVFKYLKKLGYNVIGITRQDIDIEDINMIRLSIWFATHGGINTGDVVINCAGLIRQKMTDEDTVKAIKINSIFPNMLCDFCNSKYVNMLHISTDCCFSGKKGTYIETDCPDPTDIYGMTKVAGEPISCSVIRTSVIGESKDDKSLLEWVRTQKGKTINGFTNHLWNGVTCLQLAVEISHVIQDNSWWRGVRHLFSETTNKALLVANIASVYKIDLQVNAIETPQGKNMTLGTMYKEPFSDPPPTILAQLLAQRDFPL
jgi:dTDP-4-dehydrorhamnose reductase